LSIDHQDLFARPKDKKEEFCVIRKGAVLEHNPIADIGALQKKEKKVRQVATLPKTLKRFTTCLAPQQLLSSYINQLVRDLFLVERNLTNEGCILTFGQQRFSQPIRTSP
jgi:hypothetical protein